jgi:hypothetical protein
VYDKVEAAILAMESLIDLIKKRKKLYMRLIKMPFLIPTVAGNTMNVSMVFLM